MKHGFLHNENMIVSYHDFVGLKAIIPCKEVKFCNFKSFLNKTREGIFSKLIGRQFPASFFFRLATDKLYDLGYPLK